MELICLRLTWVSCESVGSYKRGETFSTFSSPSTTHYSNQPFQTNQPLNTAHLHQQAHQLSTMACQCSTSCCAQSNKACTCSPDSCSCQDCKNQAKVPSCCSNESGGCKCQASGSCQCAGGCQQGCTSCPAKH